MRDPILPNQTIHNRVNNSQLPVPKRKLLLDNVDLNNLSHNEKINHERAQAQI